MKIYFLVVRPLEAAEMKKRFGWLCVVLIVGVLLLAVALWSGRLFRPAADVSRAASQKIYVVKEFTYRFTARGEPYVLDDERPGQPVKAFLNRESAQAFCRDRDRRKRGNPFHYLPDGFEGGGGSFLDYYATEGEAAFLAFLGAEGLTAPVPLRSVDFSDDARVWGEWWNNHYKEWDEGLVERLWGVLDRLRFHEVVEVALEP